MIDNLHLNFSRRFDSMIWNMVASGEEKVLLIEVRDATLKRVRFSAFHYERNSFLWTDRELDEPWWVNASSVVQGMVLFTIYLDTNNPDKKGILAYSVDDLRLVWWNNDFSISEITAAGVRGYSGKFGVKEHFLNIKDGLEMADPGFEPVHDSHIKRPMQYIEGTPYFDTVKSFLSKELNLDAVSALEYLETEACFMISCYVRDGEHLLANFLFVYSKAGKLLLKERLDSGLSGLGLDTFFVVDDSLFFVKDKIELFSFKVL